MTQYYLIFDIETTGFPEDWDAPVEDFENWPGILEIAWQLYNDRSNLINEKSYLIRPDGYEISDEIENLTGISSEVANEKGISILTALQEFSSVLLKFNPILVAHNCDFDINVIQAHLINNNFSVSLFNYSQICTMKESTSFCDLPNQKYPKLSELYEKLFNISPNGLHRALHDVQATSRSFFKLINLEIISVNKPRRSSTNDIKNPTSTEINKAINSYKYDLNNYPLFFDINEIQTISDESIISQVQEIFNKYYQTSKAKTFEIPYNQVINRIATALKVKDMLVRYILIDHLKSNTNFIKSTEKYDEETIIRLGEIQFEKGDRIVVKVDINNCYESIEHEKLITEVCNDLKINEESLFSIILHNALKVIYEDSNGNVNQKEKGLLIGSKPDEYLAEYFLEKIEEKIEEKGIYVIRVADEFIFFSNSFNSARNKFKIIREIIESYNLEINNSKTTITDHRESVLQNQMDFRLVMAGATDPYLAYSLTDIDNNETDATVDNSEFNTKKSFPSEIDSYESALSFLKALLLSQISVEKYQNKHPQYKYLYNIVFSQPTDFRNDFFVTDISIFSKENVASLKKIIVYYPKSEYYTALAIQLLSFLAKNSIHVTDRMDIDNSQLDGIALNMHETCIASNLTLIDLLKSNDIHEYQKYILLRCLFKKKDEILMDLNEYDVKVIHYHFFDDLGLANNIPFKGKILEQVKNIYSKTTYYPLKMICTDILKMLVKK